MFVGRTVSKNKTPLFCWAYICIKHFMKFCVKNHRQPCSFGLPVKASGGPYLDLFPLIVVQVKSTSIMLDRHDNAVSVHELLVLSARQIGAVTDGDDRSFRRTFFLIAECTGIQRLFRSGVICSFCSGQIEDSTDGRFRTDRSRRRLVSSRRSSSFCVPDARHCRPCSRYRSDRAGKSV